MRSFRQAAGGTPSPITHRAYLRLVYLFLLLLVLSPVPARSRDIPRPIAARGATFGPGLSAPRHPSARNDFEEECTIAVITGAATTDGRPLFWKNRDWTNAGSEFIYHDDGQYAYITLASSGDSTNARLGVNESGFAVMNSLSGNLPDTISVGVTNGWLLTNALESCQSVADFEVLLADACLSGIQSPSNFAAMDASGAAVVFEAGNQAFARYDANDPAAAPDGFIVRANFSFSADTSLVDTWRYHRAYEMLAEAAAQDLLDISAVLRTARDLTTEAVDPYPLPYPWGPPEEPNAIGFIDATETINRYDTKGFGVIRGVRPHEDPRLTTFYAAPGQPVVTVVLPLWVAAGVTPGEIDGPLTSPLGDLADARMRQCYNGTVHRRWLNTNYLDHGDGADAGFLVRVEQIEDWLLAETESWLQDWRANGVDDALLAAVEQDLAHRAFAEYQLPIDLPADVDSGDHAVDPQLTCWPNPMSGETVFGYAMSSRSAALTGVEIWDISGRLVRALALADREPRGVLRWDGRDTDGWPVSAGVYFFRSQGAGISSLGSVVVVR